MTSVATVFARKVGPNVRISGNWSEFLRDSTNKVELFKYLSGEVMQRFHSGGDIYITMSNGTTVGHVGPGEDMTTVCNQEEADTRIILHIIHALNCGFSSILIKTSDSDRHSHTSSSTYRYNQYWVQHHGELRDREDTASHQHQRTCMCSGSSTQCGSPPFRDPSLDATQRLPMKGRSKRMCFSAWNKCSPRVTECMVELLDSPFQPLQMDAKVDALEELFIQIYGGGQASSINQVRKTIFCQRNQNVKVPYSNIVGGQCSRQVYGRRPISGGLTTGPLGPGPQAPERQGAPHFQQTKFIGHNH